MTCTRPFFVHARYSPATTTPAVWSSRANETPSVLSRTGAQVRGPPSGMSVTTERRLGASQRHSRRSRATEVSGHLPRVSKSSTGAAWSSAPSWTCRALRTRHNHTQATQLLLPARQRTGAAHRVPPRVTKDGRSRGMSGSQAGKRRLHQRLVVRDCLDPLSPIKSGEYGARV